MMNISMKEALEKGKNLSGAQLNQVAQQVIEEQEERITKQNIHSGEKDSFDLAKEYGKWEGDWGDLIFLEDCYENFLDAVQYHVTKALPDGTQERWGEKDTFDDFLAMSKRFLRARLWELEERMRRETIALPGMVKILEAGAVNAPKIAGKPIPREDYDVYQFILHKSIRAIDRYEKRKLRFEPPTDYERYHIEEWLRRLGVNMDAFAKTSRIIVPGR